MTVTQMLLFAICLGIFGTNCALFAIVAELRKQSSKHRKVRQYTSWRDHKRLDYGDTIGKS